MLRKQVIILLFFLFFSQIGEAKVISLEDFIKAYLTKNATLQSDFLNTEKALAGIQKAEGIEDFKISADTGYTRKKGGKEGSTKIDEVNILSLTGKIEKIISESGTMLSLSHSLSYLDGSYLISSYPFSLQTQEYSSSFALTVMQPLLKNFFGKQYQLPKKLATLDQKAKEITYIESIETRMLEAITLYLDWLYFSEQRKALRNIIENNNKVLKDTEQRVKAGISELSDLESARQSVMLYENSLQEIEMGFQSTFNRMKRYLEDLDLLDTPDEKVLSKNFMLKEIPNNQRVLEILELAKKTLSFTLEAKQDALLPDLSLIASYTLKGNDLSLGGAYGKLKDYDLFLGFKFSMPFGNFVAEAEKKEAKIELKKLFVQQEETEANLKIAENNLKKNIEIAKNLVESQRKYIESLEKRYADENRQYKQGILTLREILRTSNDLSNARLTLSRYIVQYHKLNYQFWELKDYLSEEYKICIPDIQAK